MGRILLDGRSQPEQVTATLAKPTRRSREVKLKEADSKPSTVGTRTGSETWCGRQAGWEQRSPKGAQTENRMSGSVGGWRGAIPATRNDQFYGRRVTGELLRGAPSPGWAVFAWKYMETAGLVSSTAGRTAGAKADAALPEWWASV